jgi:hypothetical protein
VSSRFGSTSAALYHIPCLPLSIRDYTGSIGSERRFNLFCCAIPQSTSRENAARTKGYINYPTVKATRHINAQTALEFIPNSGQNLKAKLTMRYKPCSGRSPTPTPGTPAPTPTLCPIQFIDVTEGSTFHPFVRCLACRGIVNGYSDGTFRPNDSVTRGQLSKMVSNAAGYVEPVGAQMFADVVPGSTFYEFVRRLASRVYINGHSCGGAGEPCGAGNLPYFRPNANATRGQTSKIVGNTFFPDCSTP